MHQTPDWAPKAAQNRTFRLLATARSILGLALIIIGATGCPTPDSGGGGFMGGSNPGGQTPIPPAPPNVMTPPPSPAAIVAIHVADRYGEPIYPDGLFLLDSAGVDHVPEDHGDILTSNGLFSVSVPSGPYELRVSAIGYENWMQSLNLGAGPARFDVTMTAEWADITIRIQDSYGQPLSPDGLWLIDDDGQDHIPNNHDDVSIGTGVFQVDAPSGSYDLIIDVPGFSTYQQAVNLTPGQSASANITMQ